MESTNVTRENKYLLKVGSATASFDPSTERPGKYEDSAYAGWRHLARRCRDANDPAFKNYGARGIDIADEWVNDFWAFRDHIGPRPSFKHTIGRIDNDRGYFPGNVRWETWVEQHNNRRNNVFIEFGGRRQTVAEWARETGLDDQLIRRRLRKGLPPHEVLRRAA